ncbi:hypothetical protein BC829DRAFT_362341 [Chytridium lagenaria]|nr:hypothetical protein BC829DRAFT_362341 [Chytridium lagenaria]
MQAAVKCPTCCSSRLFHRAFSSVRDASIEIGLVVKRNPVVLRPLSNFEREYLRYKENNERLQAKDFNYEFYFKRGSVAEQRWMESQKSAGADFKHPAPVRNHDEEFTSILESSRKNLTSDKDGNLESLDRKLDRSLYLLVRDGKNQWKFPSGQLNPEELLHEAAERHLKHQCGSGLETWMVGKAPVGLSKNSSRKVLVDFVKSLITFYMKAHVISGKMEANADFIKEHAWLTKEEILTKVSPELWDSSKDMLSEA